MRVQHGGKDLSSYNRVQTRQGAAVALDGVSVAHVESRECMAEHGKGMHSMGGAWGEKAAGVMGEGSKVGWGKGHMEHVEMAQGKGHVE